jgi:dGTPase
MRYHSAMYNAETREFARAAEQPILKLEYRIVDDTHDRGEGRDETMRDYARVLYSSSFRRLQGKMQLLDVDSSRFNRNRLTHSLEVAQIARSIAADLGLSKTVVAETCALAHDIGNPPFGHYGEKVLDGLSQSIGGYEGNAQALRILRTLEKKHHAYNGLNLTVRTLFGITKYFHLREHSPKKFLYEDDYAFLAAQLGEAGVDTRKSIDAQIMDLADEIAYAAHDLEDALSYPIISLGEMLHEFKISPEFSCVYDAFAELAHRADSEALKSHLNHTSEEYAIVLRKELTSMIVNTLCRDIAVVDGELGYRSMGKLAAGLKKLLWQAVLRKKDVQLYEKRGEKIIRGLFMVLTDRSYNRNNLLLPAELRNIPAPQERIVIDYIAGMMDSFAAQEYERYFGKNSLDTIYFSAPSA